MVVVNNNKLIIMVIIMLVLISDVFVELIVVNVFLKLVCCWFLNCVIDVIMEL